MVVKVLASLVNLDYIGDNILGEIRADGDFEYEFDISQELFDDYQNRNITLQNYNDILDFIANQLICKDATNILNQCVDLFGLDIIHTIPKQIYKQLDARLLTNNLNTNLKLRKVVAEWNDDSRKAFIKYGHISFWNVSKVRNMDYMFEYTTIQEPLNYWNVSNVVSMNSVFYKSEYNMSLDKWNVSNVVEMKFMFSHSKYNQPLNTWDVSNVDDMSYMFYNSIYNHPLDKWDTSNVYNITRMFESSEFNQDISNWNLISVLQVTWAFKNSKYSYKEPFNFI